MGSVLFQLAKIAIAFISVAVIVVFGFIIFYLMQYTQFSNQANRIVQNMSCVAPNVQKYKDNTAQYNNANDIIDNGTQEARTQFNNAYDNGNGDKNYVQAHNEGNELNELENAYHHIFMIEAGDHPYSSQKDHYNYASNNDTKLVPYGQAIHYTIQIRIPLLGLPAKSPQDNSNESEKGKRTFNYNTEQSTDSLLDNDTTDNS